ncbi:SAM-dependent methyltransferase [Amycolatopsis sp. lyj-108]|uniref:SAM-dependent methyltransferase n=1 Tax=Amycolatopsis sp. lyj-108 TaxID=2789286 RepID=UPI00397D3A4F
MRPHPALVDNVLRNGDHATRDDRRLADELVHISLAAPAAVRDRDQFTARVVGRALADGITQFLDLGCGHIATSAAHAALAGHPTATIVHVDHDPHVDNHNLADLTEDPILMTRPRTLIHGNAFAIGPLLTSLYRTGALDPSQRVCVLLVDLLYYLEAANNARSVIRRLVKRLPPRSWGRGHPSHQPGPVHRGQAGRPGRAAPGHGSLVPGDGTVRPAAPAGQQPQRVRPPDCRPGSPSAHDHDHGKLARAGHHPSRAGALYPRRRRTCPRTHGRRMTPPRVWSFRHTVQPSCHAGPLTTPHAIVATAGDRS